MQVAMRPDVLAYPSPTASQFVIFIAAMLTAGAFVGSWVHNQVVGDEWQRTVTRCLTAARAEPPAATRQAALLERAAREGRCRAAAERRRAGYSFGGAAAAAGIGLGLMLAAPTVVRRRRRLRSLDPRLAPVATRLAELAGEAGVGRPPTLMIGPATLRDAFSYGVPGRYRIALPPAVAVRWRDPGLFDPVVRHELAHVRHRDVPLAWLARSVWYALAPLLLLPVVGAVVSGDASLLPHYLWRAAVLAVTVQLVSTALLRARELDADLRAARVAGDEQSVARVVARARDAGGQAWHRRVLARHPSIARRLAVLERPERATGVGFLDGFTPAFLAGLSVPLVVGALTTLLTGTGRVDLAIVIAACVAGPLLAGSVGLGLARTALVGRVVGQPMRPARAALGVAAGLVAGQSLSLAQTAAGLGEGLGPVWWLIATALLGLGAVALSAGLAELWADSAPAHRRARSSWLSLLIVESLLFAAVLWMATTLESSARAGWDVTRQWLVFGAASTLVIVAAAVIALAAAWALAASRRQALTPSWLLERGTPEPWPTALSRGLRHALANGLAAGAIAAGGLVAVRVLAGPADAEDERFARYALLVWAGAGAAAAAAVALLLRHRHRGGGAALLAAPVACVVTTCGWLAMNTVLGGALTPGFVSDVARPPLALAFLMVACIAPMGLVVTRARLWPPRAAPVAVVASVLVTGTLAFERDNLLPSGGTASGLASLERAADESDQALLVQGVIDYLRTTATEVLADRGEVDGAVAAIRADRTVAADRVRRDVLAPLRAMLDDARAVKPAGSAREVHVSCLRALEASVAGYEAFAAGLVARDAGATLQMRRAFARARRQLRAAERDWRAWERGLQDLLAEVQGGG
jgi:Zn-dependent protease with chaperone function